jgi:hypothetical protein
VGGRISGTSTMKFGLRTPSLKKRIAARTSWKRVVRHNLGIKAPRGWGWLTNPQKAAYNRVYSKTTVDVFGFLPRRRRTKSSGSGLMGGLVFAAIVWAVIDSLLFKVLLSVGAIALVLWVVSKAMTRGVRPQQQNVEIELDYERATLDQSAPPGAVNSKSRSKAVSAEGGR